jgi:outer membrane protein assembly factor BamB
MTWSARAVARILAVTGLGLTTATTLAAGGFAPGVLAFVLWGAAPYALLLVLTRVLANGWAIVGGAAAVLLAEIYIRAEVFLFPRGSTAALALIFSPLYLSIVALPAGLGLGWLAGQWWSRSGRVGRATLAAGLGTVVLVAAVAYLRPALLPGPAARFVSARERIGPPRVLSGEGALSRIRLADRPAWYQVGEFDGGVAGDVIAAIEADTVALLDPATGMLRGRIPLGAEARRRWSWSSRLLRNGSELLVAQSGGGYQDVAVLDLSGQLRWSFRPDPSLPPIALLAADLDGDGRPEFYSASLGAVYRLDTEGRVVWQRTLPGLVDSLDAAPPGGGRPGLVAAVTSARRIHLFTAGGEPVAAPPLAEREAYRFTFVDWPRSRALVGGVERVVVLDLEGRPLWQHPLGDFRFHEARAARLDPAAGPHLAVLAAGPRDTGRWRLLVFSGDGALVYDEILASGGRLLVARDPGGSSDALLLAGEDLWRYRR